MTINEIDDNERTSRLIRSLSMQLPLLVYLAVDLRAFDPRLTILTSRTPTARFHARLCASMLSLLVFSAEK